MYSFNKLFYSYYIQGIFDNRIIEMADFDPNKYKI